MCQEPYTKTCFSVKAINQMSFAYLSLKTMNEFNEINFKCVKTYIIDIQNTENIEVKVALFEKEENEFISSLYVENEMLRQFIFLTYV